MLIVDHTLVVYKKALVYLLHEFPSIHIHIEDYGRLEEAKEKRNRSMLLNDLT